MSSCTSCSAGPTVINTVPFVPLELGVRVDMVLLSTCCAGHPNDLHLGYKNPMKVAKATG